MVKQLIHEPGSLKKQLREEILKEYSPEEVDRMIREFETNPPELLTDFIKAFDEILDDMEDMEEIILDLKEEGYSDEEIQKMIDRFEKNPPKSTKMISKLCEQIDEFSTCLKS